MYFILAAILVAVVLINQHLTKKRREEQIKPTLEKWSIDSLEYMITWLAFQDIVQEVYDEWEKHGAPHPIGIYHSDFLQLGQKIYNGLYPTEEALRRSKEYLKSKGIQRTFIYEQRATNTGRRIQIFDFPYHLPPDRQYRVLYNNNTNLEQHYYMGRLVTEPTADDWRRQEYLASDGSRHQLRTSYTGGAFYQRELAGNW